MATEIRVPTLGESVTEATVGKWFKKVGDAIAADEPIVELETDKVTVEVPAPVRRHAVRDHRQRRRTVGLGALLGQISAGGAAAAKPAAKEEPKKAEAKPEAVAQAAGASGADTVKEAAKKTAAVAGDAGRSKSARCRRRRPPPSCSPKPISSVDQVAGIRQARPGAEGRRARRHRQGRAVAAGRDAARGGSAAGRRVRRPPATMRRARSACA